MSGLIGLGRCRRYAKLGLLALAVAVAAVAGYVALERAPKVAYLRAGLALLVGAEAAYGVVLAACLAGVPLAARAVARGRRRGVTHLRAAQGLALGVSLLLGLLLAEATAAVVLSRRARTSAVPAGGLTRDPRGQPPRLPKAPEAVALPTTFPDPKGPNEVEVVVLGESSAAGVPFSLFNLSPGAIVVGRLQEAIPGKTFRLNVLAMSGDTLEGQHQKLARITRKPDVLVVYCGHNEFSARLPASRDLPYYADASAPTPWERLVRRVEGASPLCRLLRVTADACRVGIPPPDAGDRRLVDTPVYTTAEYDAILADFRRRLEAILDYAGAIGALPVLIAPPGNDADFEPSRSYLAPETPRAERDAFAAAFQAARRLEASDPDGSTRAYRALVARAPEFAEAHYRLAGLLRKAGAWDEAYAHYVAARDRDGLPVRCPTPFQDVYRDLAARRPCVFIDGQAYFHTIGPHGLLDDHLFIDMMHPSLLGQCALAQAVLGGLHARRAFGWPGDTPAPVVEPAAVARRFKLDAYAWEKLILWAMMAYDSIDTARYDPSGREAKKEALARAYRRMMTGAPAESVGLPNVGVPPRGVPPRSSGLAAPGPSG